VRRYLAPVLALLVVGVFVMRTCSRPPAVTLVDAPALATAYADYQAGEILKIQAARQGVAARIPSDPAVLQACDVTGYAARRATRVRDRLDLLTGPTANSFGEMGRFVHLEGVLFGLEERDKIGSHPDWPNDFDCRKAPDNAEARRLEDAENAAMRDDARKAARTWSQDLKARLGAGYDAERARVAQRLYENHMRHDPFPVNAALYQ
jgi:hypothetical protein